MNELSIVVPCFNEQSTISGLYARVKHVCRELVDTFELVLVDDGSTDSTWNEMICVAGADPNVRCIRLSRNFGQERALFAGLSTTRGKRILVLDADLQDPPELLREMMTVMDSGYDVVYGQRDDRDGEGPFKRLTATLFYRTLGYLADVEIPRDVGTFRLMSRRVVDIVVALPEQHRFFRGMVAWIGFPQTAIRYRRRARKAGRTHYSVSRMFGLAVDGITGFSVVPLRIVTAAGMLGFALSLILVGYVGYSWFLLRVVKGWTSLITAVICFGSTQLVALGVIGEYVGRTFMEAKRRPLFVIAETFPRED